MDKADSRGFSFGKLGDTTILYECAHLKIPPLDKL